MIKQKNKFEYLFFITLLLSFQSITAFMSSRLTGMMSLILMVISAYYFYYANTKLKLPRALKILSILIVIFAIYGVILIISGKILIIHESSGLMPNRKFLVDIMMSLLPIFPFYVFTERGYITEKTMVRYFFIFFVVAVISYINTRATVLEKALETNQYATDVTNNSGYVILSLLPFLVFFKSRPLVRYTMLALIALLVLYAIKRGAIIILALCLLFYIPRMLKNATKTMRIISIIAIGIAGYCTYNYIVVFVESNSFFYQRLELMQEGDFQARSVIWMGLLTAFFDANLFQMLFGRGAWATLEVSINLAHNDWLEILTDHGLVGISIFFYYWIVFFQSWRKSKRLNTLYMLLGLLFIIHFTRSFFSMSIYDMPIYATCLMGYTFAGYSKMLRAKETDVLICKQIPDTHAQISK